MRLSEAIEALYQGVKITKTDGSWGNDYIYWDWELKRLRNKRNESYNAPLSSLMFVSQSNKDCWAVAKEQIKFKDVPIGKPCKYGADIIIKTEPFVNYSKGTTNAIIVCNSQCMHTHFSGEDDFLVEYPLT